MKKPTYLLALVAGALLPLFSGTANAAALALYEFTGASLANTGTATTGLTVSSVSLNSYGDLSGATDALRFDDSDIGGTSTGTELGASRFLSFTMMVDTGYTMDLTSMSIDYKSNGSNGYVRARVFSSPNYGTSSLAADTLGVLGSDAGGTDATFQTDSFNFTSPTGDAFTGASFDAADFAGITGTISFTIPFIENLNTGSVDMDNLLVNGTVTAIPEPGSAALLGAGVLALLRRRRR